jgi:hypothetical protein
VPAKGGESQISLTDPHQFTTHELSPLFLGNQYPDSELVLALIGAVGTELVKVESIISDRLKTYDYSCEKMHISRDVISELIFITFSTISEYERISTLMECGNETRRRPGDSSALALGAAAKISHMRPREGVGDEPAARR